MKNEMNLDRFAFPSSSGKNTGKGMRELLGITPSINEDSAFGDNGMVYIDVDLIDDLSSFPHPFAKSLRLRKGIDELAEQIKQCGVLQPVILRTKPDGRYELLAGHRRKLGSLLAELVKMPAIIKTCDDDTAKLIVTYTNLGQRDEILPSEKAKAYKMALDAIKRVAGRPPKNIDQDTTNENGTPAEYHFDEGSTENGTPAEYHFDKGKKSIQIVAEKGGESAEQVRRYIRLNELIEPLLDRVDENDIPLRAAVEISYIKDIEQAALEEILNQNEDIKLTEDIATELRILSKEKGLDAKIIKSVLIPVPLYKKENAKPAMPTYKKAFKKVDTYLKKLPMERAEKLNLVDEEGLELAIKNAIDQYLDSI